MLEIPEAVTIANQINISLSGKRIQQVVASHSPHKFAWYFGDPQNYHQRLVDQIVGQAVARGGLVEVILDNNVVLLFGDGARLQYHAPGEKLPLKHQLLMKFDDLSALSASVQMYGGLWCFPSGGFDNPYYEAARRKASPLNAEFNYGYFNSMISDPNVQKLSAKAFLAAEQRIPGLGNGVLQDILYNGKIHPKRKINTLSEGERQAMYDSIKLTLKDMILQGGRDTEKDLYGRWGGYKTILSKNTAGKPCLCCSTPVIKESYLGGSIYYCPQCQPTD